MKLIGSVNSPFARKVRSQPELGLTETVSTRLLVAAARLIRAGIPPRTVALCVKSFKWDGDRPVEVLHLLAAIRTQGGQFRDAEEFLRNAIKLEPKT